eukprot:g21811.t1
MGIWTIHVENGRPKQYLEALQKLQEPKPVGSDVKRREITRRIGALARGGVFGSPAVVESRHREDRA